MMQLVVVLSLLNIVSQSSPPSETLHRTVTVDNATYDAILTRPSTPGKHPAVFIIGGLGCYSLADLKPDDPYTALIDGLTERGFVTMRVDKNGEGKSAGPPCDSPAIRPSDGGAPLHSRSGSALCLRLR